jgi:hypothetical protein
MTRTPICILLVLIAAEASSVLHAQGTSSTTTYRRMKSFLDAVPAIDTHEHLQPFELFQQNCKTDNGRGVNLYRLWQHSYFRWCNKLTPWKDSSSFDDWWKEAKDDFDNARATSFYRYQLPIYSDLYGVDFETITDDQARELNDRIEKNYQDPKWAYHVITERANIELIVNDPYWSRLGMTSHWKFEGHVLNVTSLVRGYHHSNFTNVPGDNPYVYAKRHKTEINSFDDYLAVLDQLFAEAKSLGIVCIKSTLAYERTIDFKNVAKERAEQSFGRPTDTLSPAEIRDFEDFIMWRLVKLSAKYDLPFQIHTGQARVQGSNPILLADLIEANPKTKFILFHGGYPWVGEAGVLVQRNWSHVWIDSCWLPTLSFYTGKRAYHEWLDAVPSNRILWGADCLHAEGIYGATEFTRRCLAEVLTEKIERGELREDFAQRIGRQILRDNALELFPTLKKLLWKHKGPMTAPESN